MLIQTLSYMNLASALKRTTLNAYGTNLELRIPCNHYLVVALLTNLRYMLLLSIMMMTLTLL